MLSVKQGGIKYHFLSFWYDFTWTKISQAIGKQSTHLANGPAYIYIYIYIYMCVCVCVWVCVIIYFFELAHKFHVNHHHHVVPLAQISLTLSRHFSLSFIASGRSSGLHPVSSHSCYMYVLAGRPASARPYVGVHRSTSLMSSSLLLQQCPAYLVRQTWKVFVMGGRWPCSWCFVGCCRQDLFNIAHNSLVQLPSSFFYSCLVSVQVVHPYSSINTTVAWKKLRFILSVRSC